MDLAGTFLGLVLNWVTFDDTRAGVTQQPCESAPPLSEAQQRERCWCPGEVPLPVVLIVDTAKPPPAPPRTLEQAAREAADAVLAGFDLESPQTLITELRGLQTTNALDKSIVGINDDHVMAWLDWLKKRWDEVADGDKYEAACPLWRTRHPDAKPAIFQLIQAEPAPAAEAGDPYWNRTVRLYNAVRNVVAFFAGFADKSVRDVTLALTKAAYTKQSGDRDKFMGALDRVRDRADFAFRCAALLREPAAYLKHLDGLSPSSETGSGADGLAAPEYLPLDASYWKHVVIPSTLGHLLALKDTADFHVASHVRFLGLFRYGGAYHMQRLGGGELALFIHSLVPDWFLKFAQAALLRFEWWLEDRGPQEPDHDAMSFWSENHQMLFASGEYIVGAWWPDQVFSRTGKTGEWHRDRAAARGGWLRRRQKFGFTRSILAPTTTSTFRAF